ncbi:hypothetical protein GCM10010381_02610 [Streptomyces xantholiticus]|nr:hypothetical protein GCM10010381_02610 [Streptomyces xantholiticus]
MCNEPGSVGWCVDDGAPASSDGGWGTVGSAGMRLRPVGADCPSAGPGGSLRAVMSAVPARWCGRSARVSD